MSQTFSISLDQDWKVGELGTQVGLEWSWRLIWRRNRFEWERKQEDEQLMALSNVHMNREAKDLKVWEGEDSNQFTVKSTYGCLFKYIKS